MLSRMRIWILAPLVWAIFLAGMWTITAIGEREAAACRNVGAAGSAAICPPSAYK
jgi:hypothetical protein